MNTGSYHSYRSYRVSQGKRMGIPQPKAPGMMCGDFTNLSERKLMDCLNRLDYDIGIKEWRAPDARNLLLIQDAMSMNEFHRLAAKFDLLMQQLAAQGVEVFERLAGRIK